MNRRQISALLVLRELGLSERMESFEDRLSVQKGVYLAQASGADLGHYFNWYLRGPYASSLTQDVFDAIQNHDVDMATHNWELDKTTCSKLSALRDSFSPPGELSKPAWLELLASVHFLIERQQVATPDAHTLRATLVKYEKVYTIDQINAGVERLRGVGLLAASASP